MKYIGLLVVCLLLAVPVLAQDEPNTYTAGSFAVDVPAGWTVTVDDRLGFVYLAADGLNVTLYGPDVLATYGLENYNPLALTGLILALNEVAAGGQAELTLGERSAASYSYTGDLPGLLVAVVFGDGSLGLVDAYGDVERYRDTILALAATFDLPPIPAPPTLANADRDWSLAVPEIEQSGFILTGGSLIFVQPYAFVSGATTQGLASSLPEPDVMLAGSLTYTPGSAPDESEQCGLALRYVGAGDYVFAGLGSGGAVIVTDTASGLSRRLDAGLDSGTAQHLLLIAQGNRLTLYINGQLALSGFTINERSGHYALVMPQASPGAVCEVQNMWAYRLPRTSSGICEIRAPGPVNQRTGPGTNFDSAGVLDTGAVQQADGRTTGADGLTWWRLVDGSWVREDVVEASGGCGQLTIIEGD